MTGLNARVGGGSFVAYTDTNNQICGANAMMCRNDSAFTLARGINTLTYDVYQTSTSVGNKGWMPCGHWNVTYVSAKSAAGYGAHNHTVRFNLATAGTAAGPNTVLTSATAPAIPETDYYLSNAGAPTNPWRIGQPLVLQVQHDGTGGSYTTAFNATYRNAPTIAAAAGASTRATFMFIYDGANWQYVGGSTVFA